MIVLKQFRRLFSIFALAFVVVTTPLPRVAAQQPASATNAAPVSDLSAPLAAIEKSIDQKRQELGIPGVSLVIVKDDRVIYMKGLGLKDFEQKLPVTPDTLFAIGSATKAFTAMIAIMTADEGKLSLEDSPRKFLPYFKLRDPDADAKITIRDLLSHRSGLGRTDLAMVTNMLSREELIKVVGMAKPTAKLGEKFQYQNVMYAAAGEAVAKAQNSTWDKVIESRIFKPLGMKASDTTVAAMQKSRDFSFGYEYNSTTKGTRRLPQREIPAAAPAGAINSSARDMAQWLRFMLAGGVVNGKRLASEKGFNELISKQMNVAGAINYGFGWFLRDWNGHKVIEHGGNIDGFNAQVAMMPDQKLGFALLTNVTASPLASLSMSTVWKNLVSVPTVTADQGSGRAGDPKQEVGKYTMPGAPISFEVTMNDGRLTLTVSGQPPYPLQNLGGRRYKLGDPAPAGFFATFRPVKGKDCEAELFMEQPQGNIVLAKTSGEGASSSDSATREMPAGFDSLNAVVGSYEHESSKQVIEIGMREGKVSLVVPGQPAYPLTEQEKNKLRSPGLPETYWIEVTHDQAGNVSGIVINQPEGRFSFRRLPSSTGSMVINDLIQKMIAAYGGEANLRKHNSSVTTVEIDMENQGLLAQGLIRAKAPNMTATDLTITALGKKIASLVSYFDGTGGGEQASFAPEETFTGKKLEDVKIGADFYDMLDWKKNFKSMAIKRTTKLGDEDAYVVEKRSEKGTPVVDYISMKTFLILRRDSVISSETSGIELPQTETFSDYRLVDGVMIPFKAVSNNIGNGDIVTRVKDVRFDVDIPDSLFHKPVKR